MKLRISGPSSALTGNTFLPGDKSITHRALIVGAMADGSSRLHGPLNAGVADSMRGCLEMLGVNIEQPSPDELSIHGGRWHSPPRELDCQNSGATMRFMMGALAGSKVSATLTGSARLVSRPMKRVAAPLRKMGAQIAGQNGSDQPPLEVVGAHLHGIEYEMPVASAQVKTALLLAGLGAEGRTTIRSPHPSRDHTERMLRMLGVPVTSSNGVLTLDPTDRSLPAFEISIPGDFSSAGFLIATGLLVQGSEITIEGVGLNPTRTGLLDALAAMGARIDISQRDRSDSEQIGDITVRYSELHSIDLDEAQVASMIDEIPIVAVLATQAQGTTRIEGAGELRLKESDRLSAITRELRKLGAKVEEYVDGLSIEGPTPLSGNQLSAHRDHRIAMALCVAGMAANGNTTIEGAEITQQSFPGFFETLRSLGAELQ